MYYITSVSVIEYGIHHTATVDSTGFWSTLAGMLKRRNRHRYSSMEDGIYLEDIDYESMDPEELSKFFPS